MDETHESIPNITWGLLIGALAVIDLVQFFLDGIAIGVFLNRIIDIVVGLSLLTFFQIKGVLNRRLFISLTATFGLELLPIVDAFPLWTLDGLYAFSITKRQEHLGPIGQISAGLAKRAIAKGRARGVIREKAPKGAIPPRLSDIREKAPPGAVPPRFSETRERAPEGAVPPILPEETPPRISETESPDEEEPLSEAA